MKTFVQKIGCAVFLVCSLFRLSAQDTIRIGQSDLPYSIPIIEAASAGNTIRYRRLENDRVVKNANSANLTFPKGKETGIYTYINQVGCEGGGEWLSSNPFTVIIEVTCVRKYK